MAGPRGAPLTRRGASLRRYGGYASVRDPATRSEKIMEIPLIVLYHEGPHARCAGQHGEYIAKARTLDHDHSRQAGGRHGRPLDRDKIRWLGFTR